MNDDKKIDDIIDMLDELVKNNVSRMNIEVQNGANVEDRNIKTGKGLNCANRDTACQVPTLLDCVDN